MTNLAHANIWLHRMLTDQGACVHTHYPESFEDVGDAESGPQLAGGPAFDEYRSESHCFIIDGTGCIVYEQAIDFDAERFYDSMSSQWLTDEEEPPRYIPKRGAGDDWQVSIRDEDGTWYAMAGACLTSDLEEAHFFHHSHALQIARMLDGTIQTGRIVGRAKLHDRRMS